MSRDAKKTFSSMFSIAMVGLLTVIPASPNLARAQDASTPQTATPAKRSATQRAAARNAPQAQQEKFSSPKEAAQALYDGARNHDEKGLIAILGSDARNIVIWSDDQSARYAEDDNFAKKYEQMHRLVAEPDNETTVYVGAENWPVPFPLVMHNGSWFFDSNLGSREIVFRRIGENEITAMDALRGIIAAEAQFEAETDEYAQQLTCSQGGHDGLFSPENGNDMEKNPLGPYIAEASYKHPQRIPFHGYYFLILTAQGPHAHGGAHSYLVDGKMTSGFAIVAFPAVYRSSGIKTFIVNQHGMIYEKDLGGKTTEIASAIKAYDPDNTWARVHPGQFLTGGSPNQKPNP